MARSVGIVIRLKTASRLSIDPLSARKNPARRLITTACETVLLSNKAVASLVTLNSINEGGRELFLLSPNEPSNTRYRVAVRHIGRFIMRDTILVLMQMMNQEMHIHTRDDFT